MSKLDQIIDEANPVTERLHIDIFLKQINEYRALIEEEIAQRQATLASMDSLKARLECVYVKICPSAEDAVFDGSTQDKPKKANIDERLKEIELERAMLNSAVHTVEAAFNTERQEIKNDFTMELPQYQLIKSAVFSEVAGPPFRYTRDILVDMSRDYSYKDIATVIVKMYKEYELERVEGRIYPSHANHLGLAHINVSTRNILAAIIFDDLKYGSRQFEWIKGAIYTITSLLVSDQLLNYALSKFTEDGQLFYSTARKEYSLPPKYSSQVQYLSSNALAYLQHCVTNNLLYGNFHNEQAWIKLGISCSPFSANESWCSACR